MDYSPIKLNDYLKPINQNLEQHGLKGLKTSKSATASKSRTNNYTSVVKSPLSSSKNSVLSM